MNSAGQNIKTAIAALLIAAGFISSSMKLMKVQLTESKEVYTQKNVVVNEYTQKIEASRGEIADSEGNILVGNKVGYNILIRPESFPADNSYGNEVILKLVNFLKENDIKFESSLPVSASTPYQFTSTDDDKLKKAKSELGLNVYATAENCVDKLIDDYEISEGYSDREKRAIAGMRYEMLVRDFSMSTEFVVAEDVKKSLVSKIEEMKISCPGIAIEETALREIVDGNVVPHEIGTVGPIYAEEYESLKDKGYDLDDIVGKSGIEKAMEDELRGTDGEKLVTLEDGEVTGTETTLSPENGNTVRLTINSDFQKGLQDILGRFVTDFGMLTTDLDVACGAIAVLDCEDGSVLGLATNPTYDLADYKEHYKEILEADNTPLLDRATTGLYRPGSTFKVITATAGLNEGFVNANTTFNCTHTYEYMGTVYNCTGTHNDIAVEQALMVSCNIYFYHLSELLTIDRISSYAKKFGLARNSGIETSDASGRIGDQQTYAALGQQWTVGQVLQTAIGNSETAVTPLQMAGVAMTVANQGVRYKPHLVDSVWNYDQTKCLYRTKPAEAEQIVTKIDGIWDTVKEGMIMASGNGMPDRYSLTNLGYRVAIKTGTPQLESRVQDSLFIGYAPADDPKIAFCGVIEGGEYSKYMIRSILRLYENVYGSFEGSNYVPSETTAPFSLSETTTTTTNRDDAENGADAGDNNNYGNDYNDNYNDNYNGNYQEEQGANEEAGADDQPQAVEEAAQPLAYYVKNDLRKDD